MSIFRRALFLVALSLAVGSALAQEPPESPQPDQPPTEPAPAPRVVGQVRTVPEQTDWNAIVQADPATQIGLARTFLQSHPDSGMTPYAHSILARGAQAKNDIVGFKMHAEEALKELPGAHDLRADLAFYYAETREYKKATQHAQILLEAVPTLENMQGMPARQWEQTKDQLLGVGHFAIGRSSLGEYGGGQETGPLDEAIAHLRKAVAFYPPDDYAHFRLGEAYSKKKENESAIRSYAMAAAIGGPVAQNARRKLEQLYAEEKKDRSKIEEVIGKQQAYFQKKMQAKAQEYAERAAEAEKASPQPDQPPAPDSE